MRGRALTTPIQEPGNRNFSKERKQCLKKGQDIFRLIALMRLNFKLKKTGEFMRRTVISQRFTRILGRGAVAVSDQGGILLTKGELHPWTMVVCGA